MPQSVTITRDGNGPFMINGQPYQPQELRIIYNQDQQGVELYDLSRSGPSGELWPITDPIVTEYQYFLDSDGNPIGEFPAVQEFLNGLSSQGPSLGASLIQFTIGDGGDLTPAHDTTQYFNPVFKATSKVILTGVGPLVKDTDWAYIEGGGFTLINGNTFQPGQTYTII